MNKEIEEAIETLKKLYVYLFITGKDDTYKICGEMMRDFDQALTKLQEAPEQPPAGEFTKRMRDTYSMECITDKQCGQDFQETCDRLDRAEARLKAKDELLFAYESVNAPVNPLLSINKELLEACEAMKKVWWMVGNRITLAGTLPAQIEQIGQQADAAIAKAKKGGE